MNSKTILTIAAVGLIAVVAYGLYKKSQTITPPAANPNSAQHQNGGQDNTVAGTLTSGAVSLGTTALHSFENWVQS